MARKRRRDQRRLVHELKQELWALVAIGLSILALSETWGFAGRALRLFLRFLFGNWWFVVPPAVILTALYVLIRRRMPAFRHPRLIGLGVLFGVLLLFSHVELFYRLSAVGMLTPSILRETFHRIALEAAGGTALAIGGGMIGALLFTVSYYLLGFYGTVIFGGVFTLFGLLLVSGTSLQGLYRSAVRRLRSAIGAARGGFHALFRRLGRLLKLRPSRHTATGSSGPESETASVGGDAAHDDHPAVAGARAVWPEGDGTPGDEGVQGRLPIISDFVERAAEEHAEIVDLQEIPEAGDAPIELSGEATDAGTNAGSAPNDGSMPVGGTVPGTGRKRDKPYTLPPLVLLDRPRRTSLKENWNIAANAQKLEQTLKNFGVGARVVHVHRGPAVTRYELLPDVGVKVSRIVSLTDDIALALAARDIRIEAPIPGKSAIGIEVPNDVVAVVTLREVLESPAFQQSTSKLTIALGRDISGEAIIADLAKMPHLLVAGATGSGKSVGLNAMIASILYKARPDEVKFVMIDPKMVELSIYNDLPHMLAPVVTDPRKASIVLKKIVQEMEMRYERFVAASVRDIERYNAVADAPLSYIVVIVDELADLMLVASGDVEESIARLAQKARAAGIHLILATQRPSVDVITGVIKANIPSRIAFGVSSQVDSRTILDMAGAEKLLGRGDMLYLPMGAAKATRIQGCFVSERELEALVDFIRAQDRPRYVEHLMGGGEDDEGNGPDVEDELYEKAVALVVEMKSASVSLLQRRFAIGYARAARLIDLMEQNGIVGPHEGSKPRKVLVDRLPGRHIS
ncbi:MAG: DNA translocase FtsK [Hydrogenibacillus sp.]|nr:DNA translocase FtsK [Hydrogenibacillus sp.]